MAEDPDKQELGVFRDCVRKHNSVEFDKLARKVTYHLQRLDSSGIFGDDFGFKSIWDEYCHYNQKGPVDMLEDAFDSVVDPIIQEITNKVPEHQLRILSLETHLSPTFDLSEESMGSIDLYAIERTIRSLLVQQATDREMAKFYS